MLRFETTFEELGGKFNTSFYPAPGECGNFKMEFYPGQVLEIGKILTNTSAGWSKEENLISEINTLYIYSDRTAVETDEGIVFVAGIKAGDGATLLKDLSFIDENLGKDLHYIHTQLAPSDTWNIHHNMGKMPSVTIVDSADNMVTGEVQYINKDYCIVTFQSAFSGKAYLN